MNGWTKLDLRRKETFPQESALVALYMQPTMARGQFHQSQHYEIGRFKAVDGGRKVWWQNYRTTRGPGSDEKALRNLVALRPGI